MKNVMDQILDSWFELLNGNITYNGSPVPVYPGDPANAYYGHHIILRGESETDNSNKTSFVTKPVVVVDIVTVHPVSINKSVVNNIDDQVRQLLFPARQHDLPALDGLQITVVIPQSANYLEDDDGVRRYHRKITRFIHRIAQTS